MANLNVDLPLKDVADINKSFTINVDSKDKELVQEIVDSNSPILMEILNERVRQEKKWGQQNHAPLKWNAILGEEFGEVSKAILERNVEEYRKELIQVAAVSIAAIECLDRKYPGKLP